MQIMSCKRCLNKAKLELRCRALYGHRLAQYLADFHVMWPMSSQQCLHLPRAGLCLRANFLTAALQNTYKNKNNHNNNKSTSQSTVIPPIRLWFSSTMTNLFFPSFCVTVAALPYNITMLCSEEGAVQSLLDYLSASVPLPLQQVHIWWVAASPSEPIHCCGELQTHILDLFFLSTFQSLITWRFMET